MSTTVVNSSEKIGLPLDTIKLLEKKGDLLIESLITLNSDLCLDFKIDLNDTIVSFMNKLKDNIKSDSFFLSNERALLFIMENNMSMSNALECCVSMGYDNIMELNTRLIAYCFKTCILNEKINMKSVNNTLQALNDLFNYLSILNDCSVIKDFSTSNIYCNSKKLIINININPH